MQISFNSHLTFNVTKSIFSCKKKNHLNITYIIVKVRLNTRHLEQEKAGDSVGETDAIANHEAEVTRSEQAPKQLWN